MGNLGLQISIVQKINVGSVMRSRMEMKIWDLVGWEAKSMPTGSGAQDASEDVGKPWEAQDRSAGASTRPPRASPTLGRSGIGVIK